VRFLFVLLLLTTAKLGLGQVRADFVMDKFAGCSPLQVRFSNTSTGITTNAKFIWDFGNSNTSVQKDPSAIYIQEGTFTIRLTVSDGNKTSSVTRQVTIYKKPEVDLTPSVTKGCAPLLVDFTTAVKPGDGFITAYAWDFGDGQTANAPAPNYRHTYTSSQTSSVSLTVTNSFGCYTTIEKKNLVDVLPTPVVDFKPETGYLCRVGDELKMLNLSDGAGTLSYAWDFGDGNNSSAKEPLHRFNKSGAFTVKLAVTNEQGCSATKTKTDVLNVANFTSSIDLPNGVCPGTTYTVRNTSLPKPDSYTWQVDGADYFQTTPGDILLKLTAGSHSIRLINTIGGCRDTLLKTFTVRTPIDLKGFVAEVVDRCKYPNEYIFKDTSARAVSWMWVRNFTEVGNKNETRLSFYTNGPDSVGLKVYDSAGCMSAITQKIMVRMPDANINVVMPPLGAPMRICSSGDRTLEVVSNDTFVKYEWLSGNGQTSTAASPIFRYDKFGSYRPEVKLTTDDGCVIQRLHPYAIVVRDSVKADFKMEQLICGNNEVVVKNTSIFSANSSLSDYSYSVSFGDGYGQSINSPYEIAYRYKDTGTFTIRMEVNDMVCFDSTTRINHVRVLPPMGILYRGVRRNCDDTRGRVTIGYNAKYAVSGTLDFGDGTVIPVVPGEVYIEHEYAKTGWYNVVLTTSNGACTGRDTLRMGVYRKQQPVLSANRSEVCDYNEFVRFRLSNLEIVPTEFYGFFEATLQNSEGQTITPITYFQTGVPDSTILVIGNFFSQFSNGQVRMILRHQIFGCSDTTNWITLNIGRPSSFIRSSVKSCTNGRTVYFSDSSTTVTGRKIVQWEWYFGTEQKKVTQSQSQELSYTFTRDGLNPVRLVVTDDKGCSTETTTSVFVSNGAIKASFTTASNTVSPGTDVKFTNTSSTYDPANTVYNWDFGDGRQSVESSPEKTFDQPGTYFIKLVARNTLTGCIDSTVSQLIVKVVNAAFSMRNSFITRDNCLPMEVKFTNTSSNSVRVLWDFGDGVTSTLANPTHFYTKSGTYVITQKVFSDNGTMYVTIDTVRVAVPTVKLFADSLMGCADQLTNFTARADQASQFAWDFGDGTLMTNGDSSMTHRYMQAGVFSPRIILFDANGCAVASTLTDSIRIDSLAVDITAPNGQFCAPKTISFAADVVTAVKGQRLSYVWSSGSQTASTANASFLFDKAGTYPVQLAVTTQYGCTKTITKQVVGMQGLGGILNGPDSICNGSKGSFNATTQIAGSPVFQWTFPDGSTSSLTSPPAYLFNTTGNQAIQLVVDNGGCRDTVLKTVKVNPIPIDIVSLAEAGICRGMDLVMIGNNASTYEWTPAPGLTQVSGAQVTAIPLNDVIYRVKATTIHGCILYDSVKVKVFQPINLVLDPEVITCPGVPVQLNASGALQYTWIGNTSGLSATTVSNPKALVDAPAVFTVVGIGESKCFSDTASIKVLVHPKPSVDAGPGSEVAVGSAFQLNPVVSSDVKKYQWSPDKFLNCTGCATPVSTPSEEVTYTLTVTNEKGCTASDTVTVAVLCSESKIFIPNAFTPNGDGSNDRFTLKGSGIKIVKSLKIFDRFGSLIFERKNFAVNDPSAAWDGKVKGMLVPVGSYVYMAELSCDAKSFVRKGSVTVLY
jgi:gliding motility-associated-like protein